MRYTTLGHARVCLASREKKGARNTTLHAHALLRQHPYYSTETNLGSRHAFMIAQHPHVLHMNVTDAGFLFCCLQALGCSYTVHGRTRVVLQDVWGAARAGEMQVRCRPHNAHGSGTALQYSRGPGCTTQRVAGYVCVAVARSHRCVYALLTKQMHMKHALTQSHD